VTDVGVTFENVPHVLPLHPVPVREKVTPLFWTSFTIWAVKACVPYPVGTLAVVGETLTEIGGGGVPAAARKATICMIQAPDDSDAVAL
jgi:hypothetical protein